MTNSDFVSLHTHTAFGIMHSLIKPSELFEKVKELGQSAVAVTDIGTLAAAWDSLIFSKKAGVKLIIGCEFYFVNDLSSPSKERLRHIILLAKNHEGYKNLLLLNKLANDNFIVAFKKVIPRIDWKLLEAHSAGLICTTACSSGILGQLISNKKINEAKLQAKRLKDIFGDNLALEIQPNALRKNANAYHDYRDQTLVNNQLIKFGADLDIKIVPAVDAHYLTKDKYAAHDLLLAIGSGQPVRSGARLKYSDDFYMKSRDEVQAYFSRLYKEKAEIWCDNTLYFSSLCEEPEWIDPKFSNPSGKELPDFPVKKQKDYLEFRNWLETRSDKIKSCPEDVSYLRYWCERELEKRIPEDRKEKFRECFEEELDVLQHQGFCSYMLIVADYIQWARENEVLVSPGRGSVGSSIIGYLTNIHSIDPIKYGLIFARFQNKQKKSYPDIDSDFYPKEKVQDYIREKYGEQCVAHVSNVNTMTPKVYARDIARAFEYGGDRKTAVAVGTMIADSIPKEVKTLEEAFEKAPLFAEFAEKYKELKIYASDLSSKAKAWSTHAGGLVISKRPLAEFIPLRRDKEGNIAIEYEKERAEANGLVKMDILGLETLSIIKTTYDLIKTNGKIPPPLELNYDDNDQKTYDLISRGDTFGVFQFGESGGTIHLCKQMQPKNMEDLAAITALTRPGVPKEFRDQFLETKFSNKEITFLHPSLERSLKPTYGIPVFDECMLTLGKDVAGWDLNESDRLRKFIKDKGKHPEKDEQLKIDFIDATIKNGITSHMAKKLWQEMFANFNAYLFNKAHAVAYSFLSYQTAYLKAHFPLEFLTANIMSEIKSNTKPAAGNILKLKDEIRLLKVKILPPDINKSEMSYKIIDDKTLLTGLDALKFIGTTAIPEILAKRPFVSFFDFLSRVDGRKVTKKSIQALAAGGCLDSFGMTRKQMFLYASDYKKKIQVWLKKNRDVAGAIFNYPWPEDKQDWSTSEKYAMEIYFLGEGLSGNLKDAYPGFFNNRACNFSKLPEFYPKEDCEGEKIFVGGSAGVIEGVVKSYFEFRVKKEDSKIFGETMAKTVLEDPYGNTILMTIFPNSLKELNEKLQNMKKIKMEPGIVLYVSGLANWYEGDISITYDNLIACSGQPAQPTDLKDKKVSMKISGGSRKKIKEIIDLEEFVEEIEDELSEQGLGELEDEIEYYEDQIEFPDAFI